MNDAVGTALVTGGARGIGFGISTALARDGFDLALCGQRAEEEVSEALDSLRALGGEVHYAPADISDDAARERLVESVRERFGRLDVLVNNAGVAPRERRDMLDMTAESFDWVLDVNLRGPFFLTQRVANWMVEQRRADAAFDGCVIPEPTSFDVVCAQAGTVTFTGTVHGVAAHAAERLNGVSAIDRYMKVHAALAEVERAYNADVAHPLMAALPLPYPLVVGKIAGGEWSSSVPDRVVFEGRAPVRVGESLDVARAAVEDAVAAVAAQDGLPIEIAWTGGVFESATTPQDGALAQCVLSATTAQLGRPARAAGVPWGADMRLYAAAGVPAVMLGPPGIDVAHSVDERVALADLGVCARILADVIAAFPRFAADPAYAA